MSKSGATDPTSCPQAVPALVERLGRQLDSYKRPRYNETQVRREFIDPFFSALGWDLAEAIDGTGDVVIILNQRIP